MGTRGIGPCQRRLRDWLRFAHVIAALVLVAAGCGSDRSTSADAGLLAARLERHAPQAFLDVITAELGAGEDVALCMKEQGFDYVGYSYSRERALLPEMAEAYADPGTFARTHGYGVTRPQLVGPDPEETLTPIDVDFEVALYGRAVSEMAQDGEPPRGCWGQHSQPAFELIETFARGRDELNDLIDADSDVEATRALWSRCMAEHGYSYYAPTEAVRHFNDANTELIFSSGPSNPIVAEEFADLLDEEIATATTDQVECKGVELRQSRVEVAHRIGLDSAAADALEQFASPPDPPDN